MQSSPVSTPCLLTVAQRTCPWARPECLPLFLQFLFSPSYLVLKGQGMTLTAQHLLPTSKSDSATQIETVGELEQCAQIMNSGYTTIFCQPGSLLYKQEPLFFNNITVKMLEQLRSTTHQSEYLGTVPVNCVLQAFNGCLAALGAFMRDITNSSLSFVEFQSGAMATLDLKPKEIIMGAYMSIHCQELFVIPQFHRFDGKAPTAVFNAVSVHPAPSRKRPLFQPPGPPAVKLQRAYPSNSILRTNHGRSAPLAARASPSCSTPTGSRECSASVYLRVRLRFQAGCS